ncbi:RNA-directed DNA polymerase, eukaryota [Tanacetum coccineum]|uniref:RNA-directed DNA polymerase, eukaryota n=1 Tax=Tanacetum coccineum TaxID=301880 RepID=A0ABQ5AZV6_9ASTR
MQMKLGNGDKTAFWEDIWIGHIVLKDLYPRIYALETYSWKWSLENSGDFSVASVRKMLDDKMLPDVTTKTRWIKLVPIKVNVHAWKIKIDSLPTRFNISRRGMDIESITCSIKFNMVRDIIRKITRWWDITYIEADSYEDWLNWLVNLRLSSNYKQALEGVFYVMWWHVWQYRNKYIFEAVSSPKAMIFEDIVILEITRCGMLRDVESRRDLKKFLAASTFSDKRERLTEKRILEITRCGMLRDVASRRDLKKFLAASTFPDKVLWSSWESAWATRICLSAVWICIPTLQIFTHPRPKGCAIHCYIAKNIHYLQQFMKINPFLPPASGSNACISEAIGAKLGHLIVAANVNSHDDILNLSTVASIGCTVLTRGMRELTQD